MRKMLVAAVVGAVIFTPVLAAAAPEFLAYEGRNAIHDGQGGNKKTVEGVDFWSNGDPPHRFKVIGAITDRRMETGIYGLIRMSGLEYDIAKAAKGAGADAVILEREGEDLLGVAGGGSAFATGNRNSASVFGSSYASPVKAHVARYVVVTYLPDEAPTTGQQGTPAAPGATPTSLDASSPPAAAPAR
jgi:opacity protein-like surface antigen